MHGISDVIERWSICEDIAPSFQVKACATDLDGVVEYSCEVKYTPTGNVVYRTDEFRDFYWVRHIVRQVVSRLSSPPRHRRKGLVNHIIAAVEREHYFLDTGLYPGHIAAPLR